MTVALARFYSSAESADVAFAQLRSGLEEGYRIDNSKSLAAWNQGIENPRNSLSCGAAGHSERFRSGIGGIRVLECY